MGDERYSVIRELGAGGTATVFLAEDRVLRRKVALKRLHPHLANHPETLRRFEKEAVAIASLSHENVIRVFDFGHGADQIYLAMEYVDGMTLESLVEGAPGLLPNLAAFALFRQFLGGLAAAHEKGVIHRDIKPSNVLVDRRGCVRIADFGIAYLAEDVSITKTGSYLGTPRYCSPEQVRGRPVTEKADIFSAGTMLYRCLTGAFPFEGETSHALLLAIAEKKPCSPMALNLRLLPGLSELAGAMLAKSPEKRPGAAECLARLDEAAQELGLDPDSTDLQRFLEARETGVEKENRKLARHFLDRAAAAEKDGNRRAAMNLLSRAEVFGGSDLRQEPEAEPLLKTRRARRRGFAVAGLLLLSAIAVGGWVFRLSNAPGEAAAAAPAPIVVPPPPPPALETRAGEALPGAGPEAQTAAVKPAGKPRAREENRPRQNPPRDGFLLLKTNPPFAVATIDGKDTAITPLKVPRLLPTGSHTLLLEREGCAPSRTEFTIAPAETLSLRLSLERLPETP